MLAVEFNVRAVGENDGLARVQFRRAVGVAPQDVKTRGGVQAGQTVLAALAANFFGEPRENGFKHDGFDFGEETLGGDFLAVGVFDAGEAGEGAQARADARNHQIRPGNAHVPKRLHALADDGFQFGANLLCRSFLSPRRRVCEQRERYWRQGRRCPFREARAFISVSNGQASVTVKPAFRNASTSVAQPSVVLCA